MNFLKYFFFGKNTYVQYVRMYIQYICTPTSYSHTHLWLHPYAFRCVRFRDKTKQIKMRPFSDSF